MKKVGDVWEEDPVHLWFGLSYSAYFCMPRSALEALPHDWQKRFVALMKEAEETGLETPEYACQRRDKGGKFIKDRWANYRRPDIQDLLPEVLRHGDPSK